MVLQSTCDSSVGQGASEVDSFLSILVTYYECVAKMVLRQRLLSPEDAGLKAGVTTGSRLQMTDCPPDGVLTTDGTNLTNARQMEAMPDGALRPRIAVT